jgi:hypothetical protein
MEYELTFQDVVKISQRVLDCLRSLGFEVSHRLVEQTSESLVNDRPHRRHQLFVPIHEETFFLLRIYTWRYLVILSILPKLCVPTFLVGASSMRSSVLRIVNVRSCILIVT